jgi:hypothetical protein
MPPEVGSLRFDESNGIVTRENNQRLVQAKTYWIAITIVILYGESTCFSFGIHFSLCNPPPFFSTQYFRFSWLLTWTISGGHSHY